MKQVANHLPIPSFDQLMTLYSSYNYFGKESLPITASTSLIDGAMAKYFGTTRHYAGLSGFWGYISYKAISNLDASEYVSSKYKMPMKLFFALSAIGMVWKGNDFLASEGQNFSKMLRSASVSAKLFESDQQEVTKVEQAFNKSTFGGLREIAKNFKMLLSNKFLLNLFIKQGVNIVKLIVLEKFLSGLVSNSKLSIYYASKEKDGFQKVFKNLVLSALKFVIDSGASIFVTKKLNIEKEVSTKVSEIVLKEEATSVVMKLGSDVNNFANDMKSANQTVSSGITDLSQKLIVPYIYANNTPSSDNLSSIIRLYPNLILFENVMSSVLSQDNIRALYQYLVGDSSKETTPGPGVGYTTLATGTGGQTIRMQVTAEQYAYQNLQDIARFGGNRFMLSQVQKYIYGQNSTNNFDSNFVLSLFEYVRTFFNDAMFFTLLPSLNLTSPEDIQKVGILLQRLNSVIQPSTLNGNFTMSFGGNDIDTLSRCEKTYKALTNPKQEGIASRGLEEGFTLRIKGYNLKNTSVSQDMLYIKDLTLKPGYVYAISGKIGTGKTTFLSDIANSLNSGVFESSGTIYYPTIDGEKIPMIFCGTEPFSPPDTTLFQRLTYRLPQKYVDRNASSLNDEILNLFEMFGQNSFTEKTLSSKEFKGSTGQGKITILIAAIIYKHYLNSPVLFAIDETLANLDRGTFGSVCKIIGSKFEDSIVVSVDHNWENSDGFYHRNIDLSSYVPENDEVKMGGESSLDLVLVE